MSVRTYPDSAGEAWVVATHGLAKRYGGVAALAGVDVRVCEGAVYVLVGANGAGKSTTLELLMNLERPDGGTAVVFGLDTVRCGPEARAQIGYVPEHHRAGYGWMSCRRLLQHVAAYYPSWDPAYADQLSRVLEIPLDRRTGGLSKGEARRLQLVLALSHRPPLLLLDEPTDGLDPVGRNQLLALLAEHIADTPTTVLLATHQLHEVESLADDVGVLRRGQLVAQMPRHELQRTVRRYRVEVAEDWQPPSELQVATVRRSSSGREVQCTVVGEESDVILRLELFGAHVREVTTLPLEDAILTLMSGTAW